MNVGDRVDSASAKIKLPEGWVWVTLDSCVDILDSRRIPINDDERELRIKGKARSELYPYYGAIGQVGWIDDFIFDEELVLLGEDGAPFLDTTKDVAYTVRGKTWVNNHAHVLRAIQGLITSGYLMHYLNIADYQDFVTGTTRLKLNQSRMRQVSIPLAPHPEQKRIVGEIERLFAKLDSGVAALERVQINLERYITSVLKTAFKGLLVPNEADLAQQEGRDLESADSLLARILQERRKKWEAEEWERLICQHRVKMSANHRVKMSTFHHLKCPLASFPNSLAFVGTLEP